MRRTLIAGTLALLVAPPRRQRRRQGDASRGSTCGRRRAWPSPPSIVLVTAELQGGDERRGVLLPRSRLGLGRRRQERRTAPTAPPSRPARTLERRFTAEHAYRRAGIYQVKVTLLRSGKAVAVATATVNVRPGVGRHERRRRRVGVTPARGRPPGAAIITSSARSEASSSSAHSASVWSWKAACSAACSRGASAATSIGGPRPGAHHQVGGGEPRHARRCRRRRAGSPRCAPGPARPAGRA